MTQNHFHHRRDRAAGRHRAFFEKWLSVWVAICMAAGILLGNFAPGLVGALAAMEYASVNLRRRHPDLGDGLSDDGQCRLREPVPGQCQAEGGWSSPSSSTG